MTVIGTAGTNEGLEMIKKLGADYVFNHREENYVAKIKVSYFVIKTHSCNFENRNNLEVKLI